MSGCKVEIRETKNNTGIEIYYDERFVAKTNYSEYSEKFMVWLNDAINKANGTDTSVCKALHIGMNSKDFIEYVTENYSDIPDEYFRKITPYYYIPGVEYNPIVSGFGSSGPSNKALFITDGTYVEGDIFLHLVDRRGNSYVCELSTAHKKLKRANPYILNPVKIPNNKTSQYIFHNDIKYHISHLHHRSSNNKLCMKMIVNSESFGKTTVYGTDRQHYYQVYRNYFTPETIVKHVFGYDGVGREQYNLTKCTVREAKNIIFGNPDIKLKCQLFYD
jgi:hypothetical protein